MLSIMVIGEIDGEIPMACSESTSFRCDREERKQGDE